MENKICSLADYANAKLKNPYILHIKGKKCSLFLYGCKHSRNIKNKQFSDIEKKFEHFLKANKNVAIVIEGQKPDLLPKKDLVKQYGETGFVFYLSQKNNMMVYEIEPTWNQLLKFAAKRNSKINIASWILLNVLHNKIKTATKFNEKSILQIKSLMDSLNEKLRFAKSERPFEEISTHLSNVTGKTILPKSMDKLARFNFNPNYIFKLQDPFSSKTVLNKVGTDINLGRDYFLSKNILKVLMGNKSVFGVLGLNHVFCTKKIFEDFFKKERGV